MWTKKCARTPGCGPKSARAHRRACRIPLRKVRVSSPTKHHHNPLGYVVVCVGGRHTTYPKRQPWFVLLKQRLRRVHPQQGRRGLQNRTFLTQREERGQEVNGRLSSFLNLNDDGNERLTQRP